MLSNTKAASKVIIIVILFAIVIALSGFVAYNLINQPDPQPQPIPQPQPLNLSPDPEVISKTISNDVVNVVIRNNGCQGFFTIHASYSYWGGKIQKQQTVTMDSNSTREITFNFDPFASTETLPTATPIPTSNPSVNDGTNPSASPAPTPPLTRTPPSCEITFTIPKN